VTTSSAATLTPLGIWRGDLDAHFLCYYFRMFPSGRGG